MKRKEQLILFFISIKEYVTIVPVFSQSANYQPEWSLVVVKAEVVGTVGWPLKKGKKKIIINASSRPGAKCRLKTKTVFCLSRP